MRSVGGGVPRVSKAWAVGRSWRCAGVPEAGGMRSALCDCVAVGRSGGRCEGGRVMELIQWRVRLTFRWGLSACITVEATDEVAAESVALRSRPGVVRATVLGIVLS